MELRTGHLLTLPFTSSGKKPWRILGAAKTPIFIRFDIRMLRICLKKAWIFMPLKNTWGIPIFQARWSTRIWQKNLHVSNAGLLISSWAIFKIELCLLSPKSFVTGSHTINDLWVVNNAKLPTRFANAVLRRWNTAVYIYARIADKNILPGTVAAIATARNADATKSLNG